MNMPVPYRIFQNIVATKKGKKILFDLIHSSPANSILDFGCGTGHLGKEFINSEYLGIEPLRSCVEIALKNKSDIKHSFVVGDEKSLQALPDGKFDLILAIGVLHHIDDSVAKIFIKESCRLLKNGGKMVTLDPHFFIGQSSVSKFVINQDRGKNIRTKEKINQLLEEHYSNIVVREYSGLIRIPYDHVSFTVTK
jgi:ubiquinone/menaquinone biosynthesis C-methylase UbiE